MSKLGHVLLGAALLSLAAACSESLSQVECTTNDDCFGTEVCLRGQCRTDLASGDAGGNADAGGGGGAAPTCPIYCDIMAEACSDSLGGYADRDACSRACESGGWESGTLDDVRGNTLGCRIYHANFAAQEDPASHCQHASYTGGDVCGTWCDVYCGMSLAVCVGDNAQYPNEEACQSACEAFPDDGAVGDSTGNTVQCRMYHLDSAAISGAFADIHCPHTGINPATDHCAGPPPGQE